MKLSRVLAGASVGATNLYLASATFAAKPEDKTDPSGFLPPPPVSISLPELVQQVLTWILGFAIVVAVVVIIVAGYMYITAAGDEAKIKKATTTLTWAIVGLIVAFVAMLLVQFVMTNFLGQQGAIQSLLIK